MAIFSINIFRHQPKPILRHMSDKEVNGFSKDRIFNWRDSVEVTQFVARYMQYRGWFSTITSDKVHTFIKTRMPFSARTYYDVMVWLDTNFKK